MTTRVYTADNRKYVQGWPGGPYGDYFTKSQTGDNSPMYPEVLRDNTYDMYCRFYDSSTFLLTLTRVGYQTQYEYWFKTKYAIPTPSLTWTSNDTIKLTNKLAAKVRDHNLNLANFLVESDKTVKMIGTMVYRLAVAVHYVRRGDLSDAARILLDQRSYTQDVKGKKTFLDRIKTLEQQEKMSKRRKKRAGYVGKTLADLWLELQYGWKPLQSDLHEAAYAYEAIVNKPHVQTFRVARKIIAETIHTGSPTRPVVGTSRITIRKGYIARMTQEPTVIQTLSLDNVLGAAYEATKLSFLIDWVIPIQQFIDASHARRVLKFDKCVVSTKTTQVGGISAIWSGYKPLQIKTGFQPTTIDKQINFKREVLTNLPRIPPPKAKDFASVASLLHIANATALLSQVVLSSHHRTNDLSVGRVVKFKLGRDD